MNAQAQITWKDTYKAARAMHRPYIDLFIRNPFSGKRQFGAGLEKFYRNEPFVDKVLKNNASYRVSAPDAKQELRYAAISFVRWELYAINYDEKKVDTSTASIRGRTLGAIAAAICGIPFAAVLFTPISRLNAFLVKPGAEPKVNGIDLIGYIYGIFAAAWGIFALYYAHRIRKDESKKKLAEIGKKVSEPLDKFITDGARAIKKNPQMIEEFRKLAQETTMSKIIRAHDDWVAMQELSLQYDKNGNLIGIGTKNRQQ